MDGKEMSVGATEAPLRCQAISSSPFLSLLTPPPPPFSPFSLLLSPLPSPGLSCHLKCRSTESTAVSIAMATVPCGRGTKTIHISVICVEPSSSNHGLSLQTAEKT